MEFRLSAVQGDDRKRWFTKTLHAAAEALSKALVHLPPESSLTLSATAECRFSRFEVILLESRQLPGETRFKAVLDGSRWKDLRSSLDVDLKDPLQGILRGAHTPSLYPDSPTSSNGRP